MNQNLQKFQPGAVANFPMFYDEKQEPSTAELDRMPASFIEIVVNAARGFDQLVPESISETQMRMLRRHIYRICRYIFSESGTLTMVGNPKEFSEQEALIDDTLNIQRITSVLEIGRLDKKTFLEKRDNDFEWGVLGLGDLNVQERNDLYYHACEVVKIIDQYEMNDKDVPRMVAMMDRVYWIQKTFYDIENALQYVADFYEDATDWGNGNEYDG